MSINYTVLFDRIRICLDAIIAIDVDQAATLTLANDLLAEWETALADQATYSSVSNAVAALQFAASAGDSTKSTLARLVFDEIARTVTTEVPSVSQDQATILGELFRFMVADAESVAANTTTVTVTSPSGGKPRLLASIVQPNGITSQRVFDEEFRVIASEFGLQIEGEPEADDADQAWPKGSGGSLFLSVDSSTGVVSNGDFNSLSDFSNFPDSWEIGTGTVGTSILQTVFSTQTITVSGSPSTGWYAVNLVDANSNIWQTIPIAFDADGTTLQDAIQAVPGFEEVTVTTAGTSPNFTHTMSFAGIAGTPATVTIKNQTNGTITPAAGSSVDTGGLEKLAMKWVGQASPELTAVRQVVSLLPSTVYAMAVRVKRSSGTTGTLRIRLVNGAHSVISDDASAANTVSLDVSTVSTSSYDWLTVFFRTPSILPEVCKIEVAMSTGLSNTGVLYFDRLSILPAIQYLETGLYLALVGSTQPIVSTDAYTLETANNFAGKFQSAFHRFFNFQLPTSGSPSISD